MDQLILRHAGKQVPIPSDADLHAWQRRYTWVVQVALADRERMMSPAEAGAFARETVGREFSSVNPEAIPPDWLQNE